ncbi:hypothetical protein PIB30_007608 [Stylosanthes scabra]|uniref:Uncharacterized protein n=1 Tax=Stylosanthes scabra TaxID=79078 RepID=A0ABU6U7E3_9FABA|nr:hypothetical protein [Stylosanthes scabra]
MTRVPYSVFWLHPVTPLLKRLDAAHEGREAFNYNDESIPTRAGVDACAPWNKLRDSIAWSFIPRGNDTHFTWYYLYDLVHLPISERIRRVRRTNSSSDLTSFLPIRSYGDS